MNRYAKIYGSIWSDEKFSKLHEGTKLLYFYLISCKSCNSVGLFKLGKGTIMDEFCTDSDGEEIYTPQELDYMVEDLNGSGLVQYKNRWVMFNQWMRWNQPSSPTHVPGLSKEINDLIGQKPPKEFLARLLNSMQTSLVGLSVKKETTKKTYFFILKESLNIKSLSDYFGGEERLAQAFSGKWSEATQTSHDNHMMGKWSSHDNQVPSKEEEKEEGEEEVEGEEKECFSSPSKKETEAELSLLCSDGRVRVVSPSAVLGVLSSHPSWDFDTLKAKVQARNLKGPQPRYEDVDQFFLDAVKEVVNG